MKIRFFRFNLIGAIGFLLQLALLWLLVKGAGLHYLVSTFLAVESAIIQNYLWHRVWTWADRKVHGFWQELQRLLRFQLANGLVSLMGNMVLMKLLVDHLSLPIIPANILAVGACAVLNFLLGEHVVFVRSG